MAIITPVAFAESIAFDPTIKVDSLILGIYGDIKTGKSTLALSLPKPIFYFDLEQRFHVAAARYKALNPNVDMRVIPGQLTTTALAEGDILVKPYRMPIKWPGQTAPVGMLQVWEQLVADIAAAFECERIKSLVIDTGTLLWNVCTEGYKELVMERSGKFRASLLQIEYAKPNQYMKALIGPARMYGKSLAVVHHVGGIYGQYQVSERGNIVTKEGQIGETWDGWKKLGATADMIVRTWVKPPVIETLLNGEKAEKTPLTPTAFIETCGYTLAAEGLWIDNPSFDSLAALINGFRAAGK